MVTSSSSCSRVRPRVSGTHFRTKRKATTLSAAKTKNVADRPSPAMIVGKNRPRIEFVIHSTNTLMPMPKARIFCGKISESVTQVATFRHSCMAPTKPVMRASSTKAFAVLSGSTCPAVPMSTWNTATRP